MRELTLATVIHPDFLEDGTLMLVDHPTVAPLQDGAPDLGWEGDNRFAIYLHLADQRFIVYRLEHDNEYRGFARLPVGAELTPESINSLIGRIIAGDTRRGADPVGDIVRAQAAWERDRVREQTAQIADIADKLHWGLARSHLPGLDITRPRHTLSRR